MNDMMVHWRCRDVDQEIIKLVVVEVVVWRAHYITVGNEHSDGGGGGGEKVDKKKNKNSLEKEEEDIAREREEIEAP